MALHYDWTKTPNADALSPDLKYTACVATMVIGVGDLSTDKNFAEFVLRLKAYEAWFGPMTMDAEGKPQGLASLAAQLRGLRTNVSLEPRAKWMKRMMESATQAMAL